jgi:hypothetical protein
MEQRHASGATLRHVSVMSSVASWEKFWLITLITFGFDCGKSSLERKAISDIEKTSNYPPLITINIY